MQFLSAVVAALRTFARWLAADREARRRTRRILARWERGSQSPGAGGARRRAPGKRCPAVGAPAPRDRRTG
jgi:hypothetical protein